MQMLLLGGGDAEGLLHKTIGLVAVTFRLAVIVVLVATTARIRCLASPPPSAKTTSPLALHLSVCEKATRDSARAP